MFNRQDNIFFADLFSVPTLSGKDLSVKLVDNVFGGIIFLFAVWVVLTQVSIIFGFSFRTLSISYSGIVFILFLYFMYNLKKSWPLDLDPAHYSVFLSLFVLVVIGGGLALCSIRPNADDVDYVSRAVYYLENPMASLDLTYRNHALLEFPLKTPLLITQIVELLWAFLALVFHVPFLHVYYYFVPVLCGLLIPLVWFLVFSRFTPQSALAVVGVVVVVAFLSVDGGAHRSFGNFSFVRIWQGKVILMAIMIPLFIALAITYFRQPSVKNWWMLFLSGIASTGLSSSALFLVPSLYFALGVGYGLAKVRHFSELRPIIIFFSSLTYIFLIGLFCFSFAKESLSGSNVINAGWPTTLTGVFVFVFGGYWTFSSIIMFMSILVIIFSLKGNSRHFVLSWFVCVFVIFLNPLISESVAALWTSPNAYWRLLFILPFPLVLGISAMSLMGSSSIVKWRLYGIMGLVGGLGLVANIIPSNSAVFNHVEFGLFRYKVDSQVDMDVSRIIQLARKGPMLAPIRYSSIIPMYTSWFPQIAVRGFELEYFSDINGQSKVAKERIKAVNYISGNEREGFGAFRELLKNNLQTVVLDFSMADVHAAKKVLHENGFVLLEQGPSYIVYGKHDGHSYGDRI